MDKCESHLWRAFRYEGIWRRLRRMSSVCISCGRLHYSGPVKRRRGEDDPRNTNYCLPCLRAMKAAWDAKSAPAPGQVLIPLRIVCTQLTGIEAEECRYALKQIAEALMGLHVRGNSVCPRDDPGEYTSGWARVVRSCEGESTSISSND